MDFEITTAGIAAIATANSGGPKIDLTSFKLGLSFGFTPTSATVEADLGTLAYTRGISNYYIDGADTVVYILQIESAPAVDWGCAAVYTDGGVLFAVAAFTVSKHKDSGELVEIIAKLTYNSIATAITFTITNPADAKMETLANLTSLNRPELMSANAYLTGSYDEGLQNPVVALRRDDNTWNFPTHCIPVLDGSVTDTSSTTLITDSTGINGVLELTPAFASGKYLQQFLTGTLRGTARLVSSVSAGQLHVANAWGSAPTNGDTFRIYRSVYSMLFDRFTLAITTPYQIEKKDRRRILVVTTNGDTTLPLSSSVDAAYEVTVFNSYSTAQKVKTSGGDLMSALGTPSVSSLSLDPYGGAAEFKPLPGGGGWVPLIYNGGAVNTNFGPNTGYQYVEFNQSGTFIVPNIPADVDGVRRLQIETGAPGGKGGDAAVRCGAGAGQDGEIKMLGTMWMEFADDQIYDNHYGVPITVGETLTVEIDSAGARVKRGITVLLQSLVGVPGQDGVDPGAAVWDSVSYKYAPTSLVGDATYNIGADALADSLVYKVGGVARRPFMAGGGATPNFGSDGAELGFSIIASARGDATLKGISGPASGSFGGAYISNSTTVGGGGFSAAIKYLFGPDKRHYYVDYLSLNLAGNDPQSPFNTGYENLGDMTVYATRTAYKGWTPYRPGIDGLNGCTGFGNCGGGGGAGCDPGFTPGLGGLGGQGWVLLGWHGNIPNYPFYNRTTVRPTWHGFGDVSTGISGGPTLQKILALPYPEKTPLIATFWNDLEGDTLNATGNIYALGNTNQEIPFFYCIHTGNTADKLYMIGVSGKPGVVCTLQHIVGLIGGITPVDVTATVDAHGVVSVVFTDTTTWSVGTHIVRWSVPISYYAINGPGPTFQHTTTTKTLAFKFTI